VPAGRHRKTTSVQARLQRWGALTAPVVAVAAVVPAAGALDRGGDPAVTAAPTGDRVLSPSARAYVRSVSRDLVREEPPAPSMAEVYGLAEEAEEAVPAELSARWVSTALNVRVRPSEGARLLTVLDPGAKVQVTGDVRGSWAEVARGDRLAWVHKSYLLRKKPEPEAVRTVSGVSGKPCPDGSSVESGLMANTIAVYRAVCAAFPSVSSWGGRSGSGDHGAGRALDIMVTGSTGDAIAEYLRDNATRLGVSEDIWSQRIRTVQRSSEGWRYMSDRGSTTANHYDHVHVSVY
jgi:hypothetical protein